MSISNSISIGALIFNIFIFVLNIYFFNERRKNEREHHVNSILFKELILNNINHIYRLYSRYIIILQNSSSLEIDKIKTDTLQKIYDDIQNAYKETIINIEIFKVYDYLFGEKIIHIIDNYNACFSNNLMIFLNPTISTFNTNINCQNCNKNTLSNIPVNKDISFFNEIDKHFLECITKEIKTIAPK